MFFPTDAGDRLLANLHSGTPSLCAYVFSHPNLVEVAGLAGIDCFMADMMFTALDWEQIAQFIRAARGTGISPMIRVQAYPWSDGIDQRTVSDAARALALGATAVTISIASCAQMQALLCLRGDWHRLIHLRRFPTAADFPAFAQRVAAETLIVPTIESEGGLRDLEAIFALDGVQLRIAQQDDFGFFRRAGQNGCFQVHGCPQTRRGAVMLIEHQAVKPDFLTIFIFIEIHIRHYRV